MDSQFEIYLLQNAVCLSDILQYRDCISKGAFFKLILFKYIYLFHERILLIWVFNLSWLQSDLAEIVKVHNDIMEAVDGGSCVILVLFDLSVALDTVHIDWTKH